MQCCCGGCATDGVFGYLYQGGAFRGRRYRSRVRQPAHLLLNCVSTHALTSRFVAYYEAAQRNVDRTFAFGLNALRVREHISVTARARSAQRTGVFALVLDALARSRYDSMSPSMSFGACVSTASMPDYGCYTQKLKSV